MRPLFQGLRSGRNEFSQAIAKGRLPWPLFGKERTTGQPGKAGSTLAALRARLRSGGKPWLLLAWDISGLKAAVFTEAGGTGKILASAESRRPGFADALADVLATLAGQTSVKPRRVALAARHLLPAVVDLPVAPDKPRPAGQMRELIQSEIEPVLAEFGSLWSLGALLEAHGDLSPIDRERVTLEESMRREGRHTPLRYGETALEMELIDRATLDACLDQQETLQQLEATILSGWRGRLESDHPLWLACGIGAEVYRTWREALAEHGLHLKACLPLVWLASEGEPEKETRRESSGSTISLELHQEEVVAVHRQNGLILAARSEGRLERALQPDWLARLVADWASEARTSLELVCLHAGDEAALQGICDDVGLCTGHPTRLRPVVESWERFWLHLAREAGAPTSRLPRIVERELRGSLWNDHDIRRLAAIAAVIALAGVVEGFQQYKLYSLNAAATEKSRLEKEKSQSNQREAQFNAELTELAKDLDATRKKLEPLVNDRERLNAIITMRQNLPELLLMLAQAVGNDAVLESLRNSKVGSNATSIQVVAWSPSYTGAQAFASRIAEQTRVLGYGVTQTEILERKGRNNKLGHEVSFWLVPESDDLETGGGPARPAVALTQPAAATGISAGTTQPNR